MRLVIQRVAQASVEVAGETVGAIGPGLLVLCGIAVGDELRTARAMADKLSRLRIFEDQDGKMNLDVREASGDVLLVSQFTLAASIERGRRPSFSSAMAADDAEPVFDALRKALEGSVRRVETGSFGAHMQVHSTNDGPVTFVLESR